MFFMSLSQDNSEKQQFNQRGRVTSVCKPMFNLPNLPAGLQERDTKVHSLFASYIRSFLHRYSHARESYSSFLLCILDLGKEEKAPRRHKLRMNAR